MATKQKVLEVTAEEDTKISELNDKDTIKVKTSQTKKSLRPNRDIRKADFEDSDFDIHFTDSTCPINELVSQVREPGFEYIVAYHDPRRINALLAKKWDFVDSSILRNRPSFNINERTKDMITIGDTILMKRDIRYGKCEETLELHKNRSRMKSALSGFDRSKDPITQVTDIDNPFGS